MASPRRNSEADHLETIAACKFWKTRYADFETAAGWPDAIAPAARLLRPDVAVVLSVFLEHRSLLRSLDGVTREKAQLVERLRPGALAMLSGDDARVSGMSAPKGWDVIRYGGGANCDVRFENARLAWPRMLLSLVGDVRCTVLTWVCDVCPRFENPELVRRVSEQLTVGARMHD